MPSRGHASEFGSPISTKPDDQRSSYTPQVMAGTEPVHSSQKRRVSEKGMRQHSSSLPQGPQSESSPHPGPSRFSFHTFTRHNEVRSPVTDRPSPAITMSPSRSFSNSDRGIITPFLLSKLQAQHEPQPSGQYGIGSPLGRSSDPFVYSFVQHSFDSMLLLPPSDDPNVLPLYQISVRMNYFAPSSWITTIRRGDGEYVGDFEAGTLCTTKQSTVCIRGAEYFIKDVLEFSTLWSGFSWRLPGCDLFWDNSGSIRSCFDSHSKKGRLLAKFFPATGLRQTGNSIPLTALAVYPAGQDRFDDILFSALILERKRTSSGPT